MLAVLALTLATACGGGDDQAQMENADPAANPDGGVAVLDDIDACSLLTAEEIRSATGYETGEGTDPVADISGAAPMCAWPSADGSVNQVAQLLVSHASAESFEQHREYMAEQGVTGITQIEGPGRFTVRLDDTNMIQSFGNRFMVQVMLEPAEGIDVAAAATTLTRSALDRIE